MIFVLDNYDSFTYNLVQRLGEIDPSVKIEVARNDQITIEQIEQLRPERIIVSPGPCTPAEAGISRELIRHFAPKLPILGVCLGHQSLGDVFGGHRQFDWYSDERCHAHGYCYFGERWAGNYRSAHIYHYRHATA